MSKKQNPQRKVAEKPVPEKKEPSGPSFRYLFELLLFIAAVILYSQTFDFAYVLDDPIVTINNRFVQQGTAGILDLITKGSTVGLNGDNTGTYRPVPLVTFAIEHELFGNDPKPSHWLNVLLYAITAIVIYRLCKYFFPAARSFYLFLISLLFIAHPIHTEVVANIKSRDEILAFLFGSLSFLVAFRYLKDRQSRLLVISLVLFALACFSKENAIMFAFAIPLGLFFFSQERPAGFLKIGLAYVGMAAIYMLTRKLVLDETLISGEMDIINNSLAAASGPLQRYATAFKILGKYVLLLLIPLHLSSDYSYNQVSLSSLSDPYALISILVYFGLFIWAVIKLKAKNVLAFAFFFFIMLLLPSSNLLIMIGSTMAERFLYAPSFGFTIALVVGLALATGNGLNLVIEKNKNIFTAVMGVVILLYALGTLNRVPDWRDNYTLGSADVKNAPNSARLHLQLAKEYTTKAEGATDMNMKRIYIDSALPQYRTGLNIYPRYVDGWYNLGHAYDVVQNPDSAYAAYQKTIKLNPHHPSAHNNMGVIHFNKKEYDKALPFFKKVIQLDPRNIEAMGNIGASYQNTGNKAEAIKWYNAALAINPDIPFIRSNLDALGVPR